jgi:hypothetical protein
MSEKIVLEDKVARLVTSGGQQHVFELTEFAEAIAAWTVQGRTRTPLVDNVRWRITSGNAEIFLVELTPELRCVEWIDKDSPAPFGPDAVTRSRQLATPYVLLKIPFHRGRLTQRVEVFYRNSPVSDLEGAGGELFFPNLLNVSPRAYHCVSWFCTQYLPPDRLGDGTASALDAVIQHLWGGQFNASSEHNEGDSGFSLCVKANIDPRVSDVDQWEIESKKNPSFVLDISWPSAGVTVGQLIEAELVHQRAHTPPTTAAGFGNLLLRKARPR